MSDADADVSFGDPELAGLLEQMWIEGSAHARLRGAEVLLRDALGDLEAGRWGEGRLVDLRRAIELTYQLANALCSDEQRSRERRKRGR